MGSTRMTRRKADRCHRRPALEALEGRTLLSTVNPDGSTNFDAIIGASAARSQYQVDGSGMSVAVIDGGVNYNHEALGAGFGAGHKVVAGYDFAEGDGDPFATSMDHGTAIAGLIASDDPAHPGIAPGADIVALRVFDDNNKGDFNRVADSLQWVIDHHDAYNITAVNLSLSDGHNYTANWFAQDGGVGERITGLVGKLDALNIPVMTATGNSFTGIQGVGFTAILPDSISVTATDASDHFVANAQRLGSGLGGASATDVAAPGDDLVAPVNGNNFSPVGGTSFANSLVTGSVILLQQVYKSRFGQLPSVSQIESWLHEGSDPVYDPVTDITIGRLDIPKAIGLIPSPALQVLSPPVATPPAAAPSVASPPPTASPSPAPPPALSPAPPPANEVPASLVTSPPASKPTTPPEDAPSTSKPAAPPESRLRLWVNGQSITNADVANPDGKASGLPSWVLRAIASFRSWWSSPDDNGAEKVNVWGATTPGSSEPVGTVKVRVLPRHVRKTMAESEGEVSSGATGHVSAARRWHPFVTRRPGR